VAGRPAAAAFASLALGLGLLLGALACETPAAPPPWRVGEADDGRQILVPVGTLLDVALPGNPSTGFVWERVSPDQDGLEQLGPPRYTAEGPLLGQGGTVHVFFRVTAPEVSRIELVYRRPFEKDTPPARRFRVTIVGEAD